MLTGAAGSDAEVGDLQTLIDDLAERVAELEADPIVPPTFVGATAKVLVAGASFSDDPTDYDNDMLDMTVERPGVLSTAKKGHYSGGAMTGFAGLGILDTGEDGASAFGGWLEYNHFGIVLPASGGKGVFSVGIPTGANPAPQDAGKLKASWKGTMAGGRAVPVPGSTTDEMMPQILRGTATLDVTFASSGTGYSAAADLSITDVMSAAGDVLGDFVPYRTRAFTQAADGVVAEQELVTNPAYHAWNSMAITDGAFARRDLREGSLFDGTPDNATDALTPIPVADEDPANAMNYLAGRFYGTGGMEVGGVFHEDGSFTMVDVAGENMPLDNDVPATLIGAFGASRAGVLP